MKSPLSRDQSGNYSQGREFSGQGNAILLQMENLLKKEKWTL